MSDTIVVHGGDSGSGSSGGSSGGGSSSSGDGGSGSSSQPSAPKVDPIVAERMNLFQQVYIGLWGEPATEDYLKQAAKEGLNTWEFAARERAKPEWSESKAYGDKARGLRELFANLGVA